MRGKPIGICEHLGGIIIAPSIEAKKFGIKTATPVWEAKKLCPQIQLFHTDPEKYRETTRRFLKIFYEYTERIEKYSIDEAFMDMTENFKNEKDPWGKAEMVGREIKEKMNRYVGDWIKCSIGIGPSKLIAKIASDLQKPDGLVVVPPDKVHTLYDRLKLTDIPGIASRTERNLNLLGIKTLKNLRDYPQSKLVAHFGIQGYHLHQMGQLQGSWYEEINHDSSNAKGFSGDPEPDPGIKSMGHAYTLPKSTTDKKIALQVLYKLSEMVGRRLREAQLMANTIHFIITDKRGNYMHKRHKLNYFFQDGREIFLEAAKIFETLSKQKDAALSFRLVGVTASGLLPHIAQQSLFEKDRIQSKLSKYLDQINDKYGEFTITRAPAWQARNIIRDSVGFGRMREFKVKYKSGK